jgi:hypothetical protein
MFGCNFQGCSLRRIVHHMHGAVVDMGYNLISKREEGILVGFLVLVDMDRGNCHGIVAFGSDLFTGDALIVLLDVDHQHV